VDLHSEVVETQKARVDFFKWKLILVASLGAAASGLVGTTEALPLKHPGYVLSLIPLFVSTWICCAWTKPCESSSSQSTFNCDPSNSRKKAIPNTQLSFRARPR